MLYNKTQSTKLNDKKMLRKVGKNWKVVSLALLMAIGGGAVATHATTANANADSVNNNANHQLVSVGATQQQSATAQPKLVATQTQSSTVSQAPIILLHSGANSKANSQATASSAPSLNHNITSSNAKLIQSLEQVPEMSGYQNQNQNSNNANSNVPIVYQKGNNGSAASYHNAASGLAQKLNSENSTLKNYSNSLNAKFPDQIKQLRNTSQSTNSNYAQATKSANYFNGLLHNKNRNTDLASAASKNAMTASDYAQSVDIHYKGLKANTSTAANYAKEASTVNSYAQVINQIQHDSTTSDNYKIKAATASANLALASAKLKTVKDVASLEGINQQSAMSASNAVEELNTDDKIALIDAPADSLSVNNLAKSLGYGDANTFQVQNAIQSAANNLNGNTSNKANQTIMMQNASGSSVPVQSNSNNNLGQVLRDTHVMDTYASKLAKLSNVANFSMATASASSANSALALAESNFSEASSANNIAQILGNHPTLDNIFGDSVLYNQVNDEINSYGNQALNSSSGANKKLASQMNSKIAEIQATSGDPANKISEEASTVANYANQTKDKNFINSLNANIQTINRYNSNVQVSLISGNLDDLALNNMAINDDYTGLTSAASNASALVTSDASTVNAYIGSSDVELVEASGLASSANQSLSGASSASVSASQAVTKFEDNNTNGNFTKLSQDYQHNIPVYDNDIALSVAYGRSVYNYAPKYVYATQNTLLHNNVDFNADMQTAKAINRGTELHVLGVGFANNGAVRYVVDNNGTKGFITASPQTIKPVYLAAGQRVRVNVIKKAGIYNSPKFSRNTNIKSAHVGDVEEGTVVPMPDSAYGNQAKYGGFTRMKLADGNYFTTNTKYVQLTAILPKNANEKVQPIKQVSAQPTQTTNNKQNTQLNKNNKKQNYKTNHKKMPAHSFFNK